MDDILDSTHTNYNSLQGYSNWPLYIGSYNAGASLEGTIDEVSIYNRALPESEIQQQYNNGKTSNQSPIANAGAGQVAPAGTTITLNGSASYDPDNNTPLSYEWKIVDKPNDSQAILSGMDTINPAFTPDLDGRYTIELIVRDSLGASSTHSRVNIYTNGLISKWKFDEGTGTIVIDDMGINNGTVINARWVSRETGNALNFDGSGDYVVINDSPSLRITSEITISAWVKFGVSKSAMKLCPVFGFRLSDPLVM